MGRVRKKPGQAGIGGRNSRAVKAFRKAGVKRIRGLGISSARKHVRKGLPSRAFLMGALKRNCRFGFFGIMEHGHLCEIAARNIARQLCLGREKETWVSRLGLGHDILRYSTRKLKGSEEDYTRRFFERIGCGEFARQALSVGVLQKKGQKPSVVKNLPLTTKILLMVDSYCRGVPKKVNDRGEPVSWKQGIMPLEDAYQGLARRFKEGKKGDLEGNLQQLDREYGWKRTMEKELVAKGLNVERLITDTRRDFGKWMRHHKAEVDGVKAKGAELYDSRFKGRYGARERASGLVKRNAV